MSFTGHDGKSIAFPSELHLNGSNNDLYLVPYPLGGDYKGSRGGILEMDAGDWADLSGTEAFQQFLLDNMVKSVTVTFLETGNPLSKADDDEEAEESGGRKFMHYNTAYQYNSNFTENHTENYKTYSGPSGQGITSTMVVTKLDANNNPIQATDPETGEPLVDEYGDPIYETTEISGFLAWEDYDRREVKITDDPEEAFKNSKWKKTNPNTQNREPVLEYPPLTFTSTVMRSQDIEVEWLDNDTYSERDEKDIHMYMELYQSVNGTVNENFDNLYVVNGVPTFTNRPYSNPAYEGPLIISRWKWK